MLAGVIVALAIAIPSLAGIDWDSVKGEFENATWGWVLLAAVLYPLVPMAWATALMGCVNKDLPFVPTVLTQLACTFLNLITPNGIGGTALQLDYLHKQGVPAGVRRQRDGVEHRRRRRDPDGALPDRGVDHRDRGRHQRQRSSDNTSLWVIALVAAAIGVVLWVPKIRNKVVPAVKRALSDIWAVIRNPKKAMQLFGGDIAGNLIYPALLGLCLLAFHQRLDFAELVVRADRRGDVRQRRTRPRRDRRAGSGAHRRAHHLRHPRDARARHRARVPRRSRSSSRRSSASSRSAGCKAQGYA